MRLYLWWTVQESRSIELTRFQKDIPPVLFPLFENLNENDLDCVLNFSFADSPIDPDNDFEIKKSGIWDEVKKYALRENKRAFPEDGEPFWQEFEHVVDMQITRTNNVDASALADVTWPELWQELSLNQIAEAVHGEYPCSLQAALVDKLFREGISPNCCGNPYRSNKDFNGLQGRIADINTWSFRVVGPINFALKWYEGMPRPEEVAMLIAKGELTTEKDGVPAGVVSKIKELGLLPGSNAAEFTAYENGCPIHPSWPAMHSAASTLSFWLPAIVELTGEQYCQALRTDFAVSYGRTVAGVHYPQDNLAGLNIGMKIIHMKLPEFLAENFGFDKTIVEDRLNKLWFDWNTFDAKNCKIGNESAAERIAKVNGYTPNVNPDGMGVTIEL